MLLHGFFPLQISADIILASTTANARKSTENGWWRSLDTPSQLNSLLSEKRKKTTTTVTVVEPHVASGRTPRVLPRASLPRVLLSSPALWHLGELIFLMKGMLPSLCFLEVSTSEDAVKAESMCQTRNLHYLQHQDSVSPEFL